MLRERFQPGSRGKIISNTSKRHEWKAEISFQKYESFIIRVVAKRIMYLKACLCFPATSQSLINASLPLQTLFCLTCSTAAVTYTFVCLCSLIDSMQRGSCNLSKYFGSRWDRRGSHTARALSASCTVTQLQRGGWLFPNIDSSKLTTHLDRPCSYPVCVSGILTAVGQII